MRVDRVAIVRISGSGLEDHPHRPLLQLRRVPLLWVSHVSNLSKVWSLQETQGDSHA